MIQNLINKLNSILSANSNIQRVYSYEREDPEADPFCTITPSGNENAYNTTAENLRTYAFIIRLYIKRSGVGQAPITEQAMAQLVDSVLDDLDKNWHLSGVTVPTGYTLLTMSASPSKWGYYLGADEYRVAEINIKIMTVVDVNLIS